MLYEVNEKQLKASVVEPAWSKWASDNILIPEKDDTLWIFVNYQSLIAAIILDSYPLSRMNDCFDSLGEAEVSTALDTQCKAGRCLSKMRTQASLHLPCNIKPTGTLACRLAYGMRLICSTRSGYHLILSSMDDVCGLYT